jgi:hypothetical protein
MKRSLQSTVFLLLFVLALLVAPLICCPSSTLPC